MGELEIRETLGDLKARIQEMNSRFDRHEQAVRDTRIQSEEMIKLLFAKIEKLQDTISEARGGFKFASIAAHVLTFLAALMIGHYWK